MMGSPRKILSRETKWPNLCSERLFRFLGKMRLEVQRYGSAFCRLQGTEDYEHGEEAWIGGRYRKKNQFILVYVLAVWGKVREEPSVGVDGSVMYWFGDTDQEQV